VVTTAIEVKTTLDYGETYFWQVRALSPVETDWSGVMTFIVEKEPLPLQPPVKIVQAPAETIVIPMEAPALTVPSKPFIVETTVTPDYLRFVFYSMLVLLGIGIVLLLLYRPVRISIFPSRPKRAPRPSRRTAIAAASPTGSPARPARPAPRPETGPVFLKSQAVTDKAATLPATEMQSREGAAVIFAARGFTWMAAEEKQAGEGPKTLSEEERQTLGEKIAVKIQELTKSENLYIKYPQDAAMLLRIWAQYGSTKETDRYLARTFEARPDNAIRFLKCYLPAAQPDKPPPSADDFTMAQYDSIAEVFDPEKVYSALTKVFKFKPSSIEETTPVKPSDRNVAFKFMRLHHEAKGRR
jgi:hypothetical protein